MAFFDTDVKYINLLSKNSVLCDIEFATVSPNCSLICWITKQREGSLNILPNNGSIPPLWQCPSKAKTCLFSEDGCHLMFLLSVNSIHMYKVEEDGIILSAQLKTSQLAALLKQYNIDYSSASQIQPILIKRQEVIFFLENRLVCIEWGFQGGDLTAKFVVSIPTFSDYSLSSNYLFLLLTNGKICILFDVGTQGVREDELMAQSNSLSLLSGSFSLNSGSKSLEEFNPCVANRSNGEPSVGRTVSKLSVNISIKRLAVVNQDEVTIFFDITDILDQTEQKTPTSSDGKKDFWSWPSKRKSMIDHRGFSGKILSQTSPLSGHVVSNVKFILNGLLILYSQGIGIEIVSGFKIIDDATGCVMCSVEGLTESRFVSGGLLPLFMNHSNLSMCLGQMSKDTLIVRLCEILQPIDLEKFCGENRIYYNSFMKIILSLHSNMFRGNLKSLSLGDDRCLQLLMDNIDLIVKSVLEICPDDTFIALVFLHIIHLLDLSCLEFKKLNKMTMKTEELVTQILDRVTRLYPAVKHLNLLQYEWVAWSSEAHRDIVQDAVFLGTIALALVFFTCEAGWEVGDALKRFKSEANDHIAQLISSGDLEKAAIALKNLGIVPNEHFAQACLETSDPMMRDLLAKHLSVDGNLSSEESTAWQFCKTVETSLSSVMKTFKFFDYKISVAASKKVVVILPRLVPFKGSLELKTVLSRPLSWRNRVITELYFNTGDMNLESLLDKNQSWNYLLEMNQIDLLTQWMDITCSDACPKKPLDYLTKTFLKLLSNWSVSEDMLDAVWESNCMSSTRVSLLDHAATYGFFTSKEKNDAKAILLRLENISGLPIMKEILSKPTSNVSVEKISEWILKETSKHNLTCALLACVQHLDISKELCVGRESFPWLEIWEQLQNLNKIDAFALSDFIVKSHQVFPISSEEKYLVTVARALIEEKELLGLIEKEDNKRDFLSLDLFQLCWETLKSPLLKSPDVTLYDLLAGSGLPVQKLFLWQSENKKAEGPPNQETFPHFNHQVLCAKYGFKQHLDYIYYLKQARPSFAANLFFVDSFRSGRTTITSKMVTRACGLAHGLALRLWHDEAVGNSCVAFIAMMGAVPMANALRLHLATASTIYNNIPEDRRSYTGVLMRGLVYKDVGHIEELAFLLEKAVMDTIKDLTDPLQQIRRWMLPVAFCNLHGLPLPSMLPRHLATQKDWFAFVTCLDVFKYPYEQAIELTEAIEDNILKAHLMRAFTRATLKLALTTSPSKSPPRILLEREQNADEAEDKDVFQTFVTNMYTEVLNTIQTFTDRNMILPWSSEQNPNEDVLLTLLKCESEPELGRSLLLHAIELQSPVLAVLSTFYQMHSIAPALIAYLLSSLPASEVRNDLCEDMQPFLSFDRNVTEEQMENLFLNFFSSGYFQTFHRALIIFLPDNPLNLFMEAVYCSIVIVDDPKAVDCLKNFAFELNNTNNEELPGKDSLFASQPYILNIVKKFSQSLLTRTDVLYSGKTRFLRALSNSEIATVDLDLPNFLLWNQICEILEATGIHINFQQLYDNNEATVEFDRILEELLIQQEFTRALELSALLSSNKDKIVLAMWQQAFDEVLPDGDIFKLCLDSSLAFKDENVNPTMVENFYKQLADKLEKSYKNRYLVLKKCLAWRKLIEDTLMPSFREESDAIELEQWRCFLAAGVENMVSTMDLKKMESSLLVNYWAATKVLVRACPPSPEEIANVSKCIDFMLDFGDLYSALRVSSFFGCEHQDLTTISSCLRAAQGELSVSELSKYSCLLGSPRKLPSYPNESASTQDSHPLLPLLEQLSLTVTHGAALAQRIFVWFRLAFCMDLTFMNIAKESDFIGLLTRAVPSETAFKFSIISDVLTLAALPKDKLTKFLSEKIVSAISEAFASGLDVPIRVFDVNLEDSFHRILSLIPDTPNLLGNELLLASVHLSPPEAVEVLIRSHDCYTVSCNVEGIGRVLRRARILAQKILQAQQWRYLVRLLVGIGRYSDMGYIFQMLKDNDQFEQVLRKGLKKATGLELALTDYLQRVCPENRELGRMVAACFGLHGNQAALWEEDAFSITAQWHGCDSIKDSSKTRQQLQLAMEYFSHAARSYAEAGKLSKSLKMAKNAQIVALQLSLLGGPCVLFLQQQQLQILVNNLLSVSHGKLLAEAYEISVDWIAALHERWVIKGDKNFLNDLKAFNLISAVIINRYYVRYRESLEYSGRIKDRWKHLETLVSKDNDGSPFARDLQFS